MPFLLPFNLYRNRYYLYHMIIINSHTLLPLLAAHLPQNAIIVEAGAFIGKDTKRLSLLFPQGAIHAFEPVPEIYAQLCRQTQEYSNIKRYPYALSNKRETAIFHVAQHPHRPDKVCQAGSLLAPQERLTRSPIYYPITINVPTLTLDQWAHETNTKKVDFLWLDLQGHELAVLQASPSILSTVSLIYLEVNFIQAYKDQPSKRVIDSWLASQGFYPLAQDFQNETDWFYGNVLYKSIK